MKAANVQRIVNAQGDAMQGRMKALQVANETTALRLRVEALELALDVIADVMLEGTSADPSAPAKRKG